jgi:hypothetical protein
MPDVVSDLAAAWVPNHFDGIDGRILMRMREQHG